MKTIAFIDAGTLRPAIVKERLGLSDSQKFDWKLFMRWLESLPGQLFDAHYYDAIPNKPTDGLTHFHSFLQQELNLQLHLTQLHTKHRHCPSCKHVQTVDEQKGVDVSIALNMYKLAEYYEQAFLISGDGDFAEIVGELREMKGRRVVVIGWQGGIAPNLRLLANQTIHLEDFASDFISPDTK